MLHDLVVFLKKKKKVNKILLIIENHLIALNIHILRFYLQLAMDAQLSTAEGE